MELARRLEEHPRIVRVHYPGLPCHPDHHIAVEQMLGGFGGVISFEVSANPGRCMHFPSISSCSQAQKMEVKRFPVVWRWNTVLFPS